MHEVAKSGVCIVMNLKNRPKKILPYFLVGGFLILVTVLHYLTPYHEPLFHAVYRLLYYVPIILAAFLWGKRGGMYLSVLITIVYLPHIISGWGKIEYHSVIAILEIFLYYIIGIITGHLIDKTRLETLKREELLGRFRNTEMQSNLGQLSYVITHELKTPLASITGAMDIIFEDMEIPKEKQKFYNILHSETERIYKLLNTTLTSFSSGTLDVQPVTIKEYLTEIKDLLSVIKERETVELNIKIETEIRIIHIDRELFKEAIINLINNAMEAVPTEGKVWLNVSSDHEKLTITVTDNGEGIAHEEIKNIFKPFYTSKAGGKGLGLSIVKRIIQLHKGSIHYNDQHQPGAQFIISLPLSEVTHA